MGKTFKGALYRFLIVFTPLVALTVVILYFTTKAEMKSLLTIERHTVDLQAANVNDDIQHVTSDLAILLHNPNFETLWDDNGIIDSTVLEKLNIDLLAISMFKQYYDQVRLIDENGLELIRINFKAGNPEIISKIKLQNKKDRFYFDATFKLNRGEVYVSPVDLNIENGEIESPPNPTMRFGTPAFDSRGIKRGIILLNYYGSNLLASFHGIIDTSRKSHAMLVNSDGYWIHSDNPEDEWGFMYESKKDRTIANRYPDAWKTIESKDSCQFETSQGLYTAKTIYPLHEGQNFQTRSVNTYSRYLQALKPNEYYWKVISFVPSEVLYESRNSQRLIATMILSFLGIFIFFGSWQVSRSKVLQKQADESISFQASLLDQVHNGVIAINSNDEIVCRQNLRDTFA